jgi:hypothetical protein
MIRSRFEPVISRYCYAIPFVAVPPDMKVRYRIRGSLQLTYCSQSSLQRQLSMYRHQTQSTQWGWPYAPMWHSRYFPFRKEKHPLCAMLHIVMFQVQRSVTPGYLPISHDGYNGTQHAQLKLQCLWSQRTRASRL